MPVDPQNAEVVDRENLTDALAIMRVKYRDQEVPDFQPGQFATLGLPAREEDQPPDGAQRRPRKGPKLVRRAYSIASPPSEKRFIEFYIVRVDGGALTPQLLELKSGDRLFMNPRITGHFTLDGVPDGKTLVMVSTGTGLAPFVSMYQHYRGEPNRWKKMVIIHGTRLAADLGYREQLEEWAAEDERLIYVPLCTREPDSSDWKGLRGRVHTALEHHLFEKHVGYPLSPDDAHIFLCGNPAMINQCEVELMERGFSVKEPKNPEGTIHFERYW